MRLLPWPRKTDGPISCCPTSRSARGAAMTCAPVSRRIPTSPRCRSTSWRRATTLTMKCVAARSGRTGTWPSPSKASRCWMRSHRHWLRRPGPTAAPCRNPRPTSTTIPPVSRVGIFHSAMMTATVRSPSSGGRPLRLHLRRRKLRGPSQRRDRRAAVRQFLFLFRPLLHRPRPFLRVRP